MEEGNEEVWVKIGKMGEILSGKEKWVVGWELSIVIAAASMVYNLPPSRQSTLIILLLLNSHKADLDHGVPSLNLFFNKSAPSPQILPTPRPSVLSPKVATKSAST